MSIRVRTHRSSKIQSERIATNNDERAQHTRKEIVSETIKETKATAALATAVPLYNYSLRS